MKPTVLTEVRELRTYMETIQADLPDLSVKNPIQGLLGMKGAIRGRKKSQTKHKKGIGAFFGKIKKHFTEFLKWFYDLINSSNSLIGAVAGLIIGVIMIALGPVIQVLAVAQLFGATTNVKVALGILTPMTSMIFFILVGPVSERVFYWVRALAGWPILVSFYPFFAVKQILKRLVGKNSNSKQNAEESSLDFFAEIREWVGEVAGEAHQKLTNAKSIFEQSVVQRKARLEELKTQLRLKRERAARTNLPNRADLIAEIDILVTRCETRIAEETLKEEGEILNSFREIEARLSTLYAYPKKISELEENFKTEATLRAELDEIRKELGAPTAKSVLQIAEVSALMGEIRRDLGLAETTIAGFENYLASAPRLDMLQS